MRTLLRRSTSIATVVEPRDICCGIVTRMSVTIVGGLTRPRLSPRAALPLLVPVALLAATVRGQTPPPSPTPTPEPVRSGVSVEVVVTAPRIEVPLKENPAATTVVEGEELAAMPKSIAADEALRLVPGVKVDNQADGERVHLSIRGQGILTERGIRGVKVLLDGLPLNDPTGFAPDLFDVDWATVKRIEVDRGPSSALFGGGASGGIISISTGDGGPTPRQRVALDTGSYGFWKALGEASGSTGAMSYRVSASRSFADGYRVHTAFHATNLYSKFNFGLGGAGHVTVIVAGTSFFNENAEGLDILQVHQDPRQPNPDALTYNEFQRTRRGTVGIVGQAPLSSGIDVAFALYGRHWTWDEAVPSSVEHASYDSPGGYLQLVAHWGSGTITNHLNLGTDLDWQSIDDSYRPNLGRAREGAAVLADQTIHQRGVGVYLLDRLELSPTWSVMAGLRHDAIRNTLDDLLKVGGVDLSGGASFDKTTARVGAAWNPSRDFGLYANFSQGFLPPATEELSHNPARVGGFNQGLKPATSRGEEIGARGAAAGVFTYDLAIYRLLTDNDFGRYRVPGRPLETFYQNAGSSRRYGVEASVGVFPTPRFSMEVAYTYSHFLYDRVNFNNLTYTDTRLPNSPEHQATLDAEYRITPDLVIGAGAQIFTRAYIDPTNTTWIGGYTLFDARVTYRFQLVGLEDEVVISARNLAGKRYIAFTEPDPDGNSYQPGPLTEVFAGLHLSF
jgi:iron complex outermembrane recepter protein